MTDRHLRLAEAYTERFPKEVEVMIEANHPPLDELLKLYPFIRTLSPR